MQKDFTQNNERLSLMSILATSLMTTVHHYYRFGFLTVILGVITIGLPIALLLWFKNAGSRIALVAYGLVGGWIVVGFGLVDGMWNSTLKLFLGNFLLVEYGQYFSWDPVGNFPFEASGVLASISSLFAGYYLYRFLRSKADFLQANGPSGNRLAAAAVLIVTVALGAFLANRNHGDAAAIPENGTVKIGVILPTTGGAALLADSFIKAVQLAQKDVEGKTTKHTYELVLAKSSVANPLQTKAAIQKLIKVDRVQAIVGGISASGEIVKSYTTAAEIPHICVCSILGIGDGVYNFTMISTPRADAAAWVKEAEKRNIKTIAILTMAYPSIDGHVKALKDEALTKGMKIVYEKKFDGATADFGQMIAEARASGPDVYFVESFNPTLDILGQQLRDAGVRAISAFVTPSLSAKRELFEGAWYVDTNLVEIGFRERFEKTHPGTQFVTHMMPFAYDAFNLLVQGFESKDGVVRYIQNIDEYRSVAGRVTKERGSGTFEPTPAIWTIRNGKPELLY